MKMEYSEWRILSSLELNLCLKMLGGCDWQEFHVNNSSVSIEQKMLNAFLELIRMGLLTHSGSAYQSTPLMKELFTPMLWPEETQRVDFRQSERLWGFQSKGRVTAVRSLPVQDSEYAVTNFSEAEWLVWLENETDTMLKETTKQPDETIGSFFRYLGASDKETGLLLVKRDDNFLLLSEQKALPYSFGALLQEWR